MNKRLHAGAIALACLGVLLAYAGYLGLRGADQVSVRAPGPERAVTDRALDRVMDRSQR